MIILKEINKSYFQGKPNQINALRGVNLEIKDGELIAITGPSGSGKSTLLHLLALLDNPTSGQYELDGVNVLELPDSQRAAIRCSKVGIVLQDYGLIGELTALQNVMLPLIIAGISGQKAKKKAKSALDSVGLMGSYEQKAALLSGGQKQRVSIARAIVRGAKVILADEPTGALDSTTTNEIMELLFSLNRTGITVIIVTHNPEIASCCPREIRIVDGKII